MDSIKYLESKIREVENFPTPGVRFKDIAPLFEDPKALKLTIEKLADYFSDKKVSKVVGIDARGFLLASAVAYLLKAGVVMARKKGKLPYRTVSCSHSLEYGQGFMEIHEDAVKPGEKILIIDDVLATGGTAGAAVGLVRRLGGEVSGMGFLLEMTQFNARVKFPGMDIYSLIMAKS